MALAAEYLLGATIIGTIAGVFGLILLFRTLQQNQTATEAAIANARAAADAVDVARNQMRAYVNITEINANIFAGKIKVFGKYKNTGQTSTRNLRITITASCCSSPNGAIVPPTKMRSSKFFPNDLIKETEADFNVNIGPVSGPGGSTIGPRDDMLMYFISVQIQFEDVYEIPRNDVVEYWGTKPPGERLDIPVKLARQLPKDPTK